MRNVIQSKQHYEALLGPIYSWMIGGLEAGIQRNTTFLSNHDLVPRLSGHAVDLGAGCGVLSIPLAQRGYGVTAIDIDSHLLQQLEQRAGALPIKVVEDDLCQFRTHIELAVELVVCTVDTLLHLASKRDVQELLHNIHQALEDRGQLILTFRDLSAESFGLDRVIPVRSDKEMILTCLLEYEPDTVQITDILYRWQEGEWKLSTGSYSKLRLSESWVQSQLLALGFAIQTQSNERGMVTIIASKGSE